ncbi:MAG: hypothetical protein ACUVTP_00840 [Candidatus Fervidibacter sp.]|uniref:hypothetical protein n=1 Tax=Candidatus Fervidibacter sp. TaxID=3100871 RepID=UPI00404A0BCB
MHLRLDRLVLDSKKAWDGWAQMARSLKENLREEAGLVRPSETLFCAVLGYAILFLVLVFIAFVLFGAAVEQVLSSLTRFLPTSVAQNQPQPTNEVPA